ncbi:STAS domain-containing protein [Actinomadura chibensis]|uniref:STAS domain-containing protein n=2 Tax=Actinomadura chibensis TaxID=392828 RepID=A0A5D0NLB5_9ACTN|nr:STAS domain-containing protein [Actinomadura chibensis]
MNSLIRSRIAFSSMKWLPIVVFRPGRAQEGPTDESLAYTEPHTVAAPPVRGEERMTVWRITEGEGGTEPGERGVPCDIVEHDTALLRIAAATGSPWLLMAGEIDVSNSADVTRAVRGARARGAGDVHIDLGAVDFVDVAGLRAFTLAAGELHERGRMLVLHAVSTHLDKLFGLIGWSETPGLRIHCRPRG